MSKRYTSPEGLHGRCEVCSKHSEPCRVIEGRTQQEAGMEDGESASVEGGLEEGNLHVRNTTPRSGSGLGGTRAPLLWNIDFIEQGITEVGT